MEAANKNYQHLNKASDAKDDNLEETRTKQREERVKVINILKEIR